MAKVGEGDPRWIVENRGDGKNVNNWHWSESDRLEWSKNIISSLLKQTIIDNDQMLLKITAVPTVEGECTVNNRKGKTIFLYELNVKANWTAESKVESKEGEEAKKSVKVSGDFNIPYISDENGEEDPRVTFTVTSKQDDENKDLINKLQSGILKSTCVPFVQKQCVKYVQTLKQEFTIKNQTSPVNSSTTATTTPTPIISSTTTTTTPVVKKTSSNTKTLTINEEFQSSPMDAYDAFVNPDKIRMFTHDKVEFDAKSGGLFSMYGGMIKGKNIELIPGSKIAQKWRLGSWDAGVEADVTITFKVDDRKAATKVDITVSGIPTEEYEKTEEGWRRNIIERLKSAFGYGSRLNF